MSEEYTTEDGLLIYVHDNRTLTVYSKGESYYNSLLTFKDIDEIYRKLFHGTGT